MSNSQTAAVLIALSLTPGQQCPYGHELVNDRHELTGRRYRVVKKARLC